MWGFGGSGATELRDGLQRLDAGVRAAIGRFYAQTRYFQVDPALNAGEPSPEDAAIAKWWSTELQGRVVDTCLQLHGGYGYLADYEVERIVRDLRVHRILEGTNEIMRVIVSRELLKP